MFPKIDEIMSDKYLDFKNMEHNYNDTMNVKISDFMIKGHTSVDLDMPCIKFISTMRLIKFRRISVTHKGNLLAGVVSIVDVPRVFKSCMSS